MPTRGVFAARLTDPTESPSAAQTRVGFGQPDEQKSRS